MKPWGVEPDQDQLALLHHHQVEVSCDQFLDMSVNCGLPSKVSEVQICSRTIEKARGGGYLRKLDGVGPVDNRPSTDYLHHFVQ